VLALGAALVVRFPWPRGSKVPVLLSYPALALCAGVGVPGLWRAGRVGKAACAAGLLGLLVPATVIGFAGALRARSPQADDAFREAAAWVRETTPGDAVLVDADDDLALAAGRRLLVAEGPPPPSWPAEVAALRRRCRDALVGGTALDGECAAHLRALGTPVFVVWRDAAADPAQSTGFRNERFAIAAWSPEPAP
jgi:hypothetical protein